MIRATKIKMKPGCGSSNNLLEIDKIYLVGDLKEDGYFYKSDIYDFLKNNPYSTIEVNIYPYPKVEPVISQNGEKYVRSKVDRCWRKNI